MSASGHWRRAAACILATFADMKVLADKVVSHDLVTGLASGKTSEEIAVYQVEDGHITHIVYVERQLR